jgi:hypothetical protein
VDLGLDQDGRNYYQLARQEKVGFCSVEQPSKVRGKNPSRHPDDQIETLDSPGQIPVIRQRSPPRRDQMDVVVGTLAPLQPHGEVQFEAVNRPRIGQGPVRSQPDPPSIRNKSHPADHDPISYQDPAPGASIIGYREGAPLTFVQRTANTPRDHDVLCVEKEEAPGRATEAGRVGHLEPGRGAVDPTSHHNVNMRGRRDHMWHLLNEYNNSPSKGYLLD